MVYFNWKKKEIWYLSFWWKIFPSIEVNYKISINYYLDCKGKVWGNLKLRRNACKD